MLPRDLAGQQAARQGEVWDEPEPETLAERQQLVLRAAGEPRVLALLRHVREAEAGRDRACPLDTGRRVVRGADGDHDPLVDELLQRAEGLFDRRARILLVVLVEVDALHLEAPQ